MNIKQAFETALNTRAEFTKVGIERRRVSNAKNRLKKGNYPKENTMRKWLQKAGWTSTPEKWVSPSSNKNKV